MSTNQGFTQISDHIAVIKRRRLPFVFVFAIVFAIAILLATKLPATYESEATILIEDQEIPEEFVQSTVTTFADEQIQIIAQRVMTRRNLEEIALEFDLYNAVGSGPEMDNAVDQLRETIFVDPVRASVVDERTQRTGYVTIAFTVRFQHGEPQTTKDVTDRLSLLFLQANASQRAELASETTSFLEDEAEKLEEEVFAIETEMAEFKEKYKDSMPELANLNFQQLERAERDLEVTQREIRANHERQALLRAELASIEPYQSVFNDEGEPISVEDRLAALQRELMAKSSIYSADHPDMKRLRREIELLSGSSDAGPSHQLLASELEEKRLELQEAQRRYSSDHPTVTRLATTVAALEDQLRQASARERGSYLRRPPDNPRYIQVEAQLKFAEQELSALIAQRDEVRSNVRAYQDRLAQTPQTEREWLRVTRDYDVTREKYREIRAQLDDAYRAQTLESAQKGQRFSLLDPPRLPTKPISPNRPFILFAGFLFAFALSTGTVVALETTDSTVRSSDDVAMILGAPPLATLPVLRNRRDVARSIRSRLLTGLVFASGIVLLVAELT